MAFHVSVTFPFDHVHLGDEYVSMQAVHDCARAADAAGFTSGTLTDHPVPTARWLDHGGHYAQDPFVVLAMAAAVTSRLKVQTNIIVLPYRNPFLMARSAASLDVLSDGRLILGVAAGYLESEFAALGVPFAERNERFDEALAVLKRAWSEQGVALEGRGFRAEGNTALPRPVQRPHPPLWVGGNSRRAIRRAVEHGDGWLPFPASARLAGVTRTAVIATPEDLTARIALAREHARAVGRRAPLEIGFVPFGFERGPSGAPDDGARLAEQAEKLAPLGVGWLLLTLPCRTRAEYVERVGRLGDALPRRRGQVPPAIAQE
jgi:probable F420-dependent oxidoreductase